MSRSEEAAGEPGPQPAKFSRYRSVRLRNVATNHGAGTSVGDSHARADQDDTRTLSKEIPPEPVLDPLTANSIARSKSRYRRRAASVSAVDNDPTTNTTAPQTWDAPPMPPVPSLPSMAKQGTQRRPSSPGGRIEDDAEAAAHTQHDPMPPPARHQAQEESRQTGRAPKRLLHRRATEDHLHRTGTNDTADHSRIAERGDRERRAKDEEEGASGAKQPDAEQILAKQKKKDLERLQIELANAQPATDAPKTRSPIVEKFSLLTRRRKSTSGTSPTSSSACSAANSMDCNRANTDLPEVPKLPKGIEAGGKGIVPQKDAPVSAVNHGDRIVSVRCKQHTFIFPVSPDTTPVDILLATAKNVNFELEWTPAEGIVKESYGPLGLERRLRRYEHIRDVMNSWDRDTHNHLVVSASDNSKRDRDLDVSFVPETDEPPSGTHQYMYHSNRPGKWNKRWITLTDQGQILLSKKQDAGPSDKDAVSLCHLSDYDLYMPTESQMRRHLKPPKKYCFAVKSQHKPAMFVDTENYVQYFCTDDPRVAAQFYDKVQSWRSWYLVDRSPTARGGPAPKTEIKSPQPNAASQPQRRATNVASAGGHRLRVSVDETPYQLGEFEPLLDMKRFDKRISLFGQDFLTDLTDEPEQLTSPPKKRPTEQKNVRNVSGSVGDKQAEGKSEGGLIARIQSANDPAFTGGGLLGGNYEDRRVHMEKNMSRKESINNQGDFGGNTAVLNRQAAPHGADKSGPNWFPSALQHSARQRDVGERPTTSGGDARRSSFSRSRSQPRAPPVPQSRVRHDTHPNPLGSHHLQSPVSSPSLTQSSGDRFQPLNPLVDLTPTFKEAPQWIKKGHGVKAEGVRHLVDFIGGSAPQDGPNTRGPLHRESPASRPPLSNPDAFHRSGGGGGLSRTRSKSSGSPATRTLVGEIPPVPTLPGRHEGRTMTMSARDQAKVNALRAQEHSQHRDNRGRDRGRERERAYQEYGSVSGRTGTLKVV